MSASRDRINALPDLATYFLCPLPGLLEAHAAQAHHGDRVRFCAPIQTGAMLVTLAGLEPATSPAPENKDALSPLEPAALLLLRGQGAMSEQSQFIIVVAFGALCFGCGCLTAFIVTRNKWRDEMIKRGAGATISRPANGSGGSHRRNRRRGRCNDPKRRIAVNIAKLPDLLQRKTMTPLPSPSPFLIDEIVLVDLLALFLSVVTVSILWYAVKKIFPDDVKDLQSFLTFIVAVVPFVMIIYFGLAVINYDAVAGRSGWPPILPLSGLLSPLILGAAVFYIAQTVWLWFDWRKFQMPR
jgi:predicted permease